MNQFYPGPEYTAGAMGPLRIFTKIREDIRNFVFIAGVVDTGEKLFTGVNDNSKRPEWDAQRHAGN
jgi:hypothetical protein